MTTEPLFVPEQLYHRKRDIHRRFGGQEQGGMITPAKHNLIFLVTGSSGRQHGYEDRWSEDGTTFFYYGEGQIGDMQFNKANVALSAITQQMERMYTCSKRYPKRAASCDIGVRWSVRVMSGLMLQIRRKT